MSGLRLSWWCRYRHWFFWGCSSCGRGNSDSFGWGIIFNNRCCPLRDRYRQSGWFPSKKSIVDSECRIYKWLRLARCLQSWRKGTLQSRLNSSDHDWIYRYWRDKMGRCCRSRWILDDFLDERQWDIDAICPSRLSLGLELDDEGRW